MFNSRLIRPRDPGLKCEEPSLTQQHFKDDCDINKIIDRYNKTGILAGPPGVNMGRRPQFGDFSLVSDYQTAQMQLQQAEETFMELPSKLRKRFNNSVQELISFMENPENREQAIELGLLDKPVVPVSATRGSAPAGDSNKMGASGSNPAPSAPLPT